MSPGGFSLVMSEFCSLYLSSCYHLLSSEKVPFKSLSVERVWDVDSGRSSAVSPNSLSVSSPSRSQITVIGLLRILLRALYLLLAADGGVRDRAYFAPFIEKDKVGEDREKAS